MRSLLGLAVLSLLFLPRPVLAERAPTFEALQARAQAAFRAKRYEEACPLFARTAERAPRALAAATYSDLGLCWHRLGEQGPARTAARTAIALAPSTSARDVKVRKQSYFNLSAMEARAVLPDKDRGCVTLAGPSTCATSLTACLRDTGHRSSGTTTLWRALRIAHAKQDAVWEPGEDASESLSPHALVGTKAPGSRFDRPAAQTLAVRVLEEIESSCSEEDPGEDCGAGDGTMVCWVVHADACTGYVGFVCEDDGYRRGKRRRFVTELYLQPR